MLEDLYREGTLALLDDAQARRPTPVKKTEAPGMFGGFGVGTLPKAGAAGALSTAAGIADVLGAFGSVAGAYPEALGVQPTPEQRKQAEDARQKLLASGPNYSSGAADPFRHRAEDLMPDPQTSGRATQVIAGLGKFVGQVVTAAPLGPLAPAGVAGTVGLEEAQKLKEQGVPLGARTAAGVIQGAVAGVSTVLPVVGATVGRTVGAVALAGTTNEAGLAATQTILRHAGQEKLSNQYDPLDPWNVALSYAMPAVIGGAVHGVRAQAPKTLADVVRTNESRGVRYAKDGTELQGPPTKYGTAKGDMQVLDSTALDPGYGVKPAQKLADGSIDPADRARVGVELVGKFEAKYGSPEKAMAAYNWGPGNLEAAISKYGDKWIDHAPNETQVYIARGMKQVNEGRVAEAVRADPELVDAARVQQVAEHVDAARLTPDTDIAGHNANVEAFQRAHDQLAAGDRVDVEHLLLGKDMADAVIARMRERGPVEDLFPQEPAPAPRIPEPAPPGEAVAVMTAPKARPAEPVQTASPPKPGEPQTPVDAAKTTPLAGAAAEALRNRPDLTIQHADGTTMKASDYLASAHEEAATYAKDASLVQAAVACLLGHA